MGELNMDMSNDQLLSGFFAPIINRNAPAGGMIPSSVANNNNVIPPFDIGEALNLVNN